MISIVIPLYNKEKSIISTLQSVCDQTNTDWELIVVDDGSTDNSLDVIRDRVNELKSEKVRVIHKMNRGVCSARNRGIQEAKGDYIAFLDADDIWDKEYLAEQVMMIADFPEAAMWGINFAEINNGKLVRKLETALPDGYRGYVENYFQMPGRISDLFCSSSVVIRKAVFDKVGLFDERIKYAEDSDMWFRIIATHPVAFYDRYMVFYRFDAENRALHREIKLKYFLPYYVDKYKNPQYQQNTVFYTWVNRWSSQRIVPYYFLDPDQRKDAKEAAKKLDYNVLPFKYRLYLKTPYWLGSMIYRLEKRIRR
jgi:glycosyltransferase involved in cell wall biosynthesis